MTPELYCVYTDLLPWQVLKMQDLLKRGIAVHHSGILPLIKEVCKAIHTTQKALLIICDVSLANNCCFPQIVELLFQRGLVRVSD